VIPNKSDPKWKKTSDPQK